MPSVRMPMTPWTGSLAVLVLVLAAGIAAACSIQVFTLTPYHAADGGFTISVPGGTMDETGFQATNAAFDAASVHRWTNQRAGGPRVVITCGEMRASYVGTRSATAILADAADSYVAEAKGGLVSRESVDVGGYPGIDQRISIAAGDYRIRLVLAERQLCAIQVTGSPALVDGADVQVILDSFMLDR